MRRSPEITVTILPWREEASFSSRGCPGSVQEVKLKEINDSFINKLYPTQFSDFVEPRIGFQPRRASDKFERFFSIMEDEDE